MTDNTNDKIFPTYEEKEEQQLTELSEKLNKELEGYDIDIILDVLTIKVFEILEHIKHNQTWTRYKYTMLRKKLIAEIEGLDVETALKTIREELKLF